LTHDPLQASVIACHMMQIEKELGHKDEAQRDAYDLIELWSKREGDSVLPDTSYPCKEQANVLTIAYCTLAGLSLDAGRYEQALTHVNHALHTAGKSYAVRQAEASLMYGRILEAMQQSEEAEQVFRKAVEIASTTRSSMLQMSAHTSLAAHLLKHGQQLEGEAVLMKAQALMRMVTLQQAANNDEASTEQEYL
jgi:tetratricopeptide (TPR) repeat protein